jgi:hypothetical protein
MSPSAMQYSSSCSWLADWWMSNRSKPKLRKQRMSFCRHISSAAVQQLSRLSQLSCSAIWPCLMFARGKSSNCN